MNRIRKLLRLPSEDKRLLVHAAYLVSIIRITMWLIPFQTLERMVMRVSRPTAELREADEATIRKISWAVILASCYVPSATCLTQALAAHVLIGRRGYPVRVLIGTRKGETGELEFHAWVEVAGETVLGGRESKRQYAQLYTLGGIEHECHRGYLPS